MGEVLIRALFLSLLLALSSTGQDTSPDPVTTFRQTYEAVRDNYPMLELASWRGEGWSEEFSSKLAAAPTRHEAFGLMEEFVCRLNDPHTQLCWPGKSVSAEPPVRLHPVLTGTSLPAVWPLGVGRRSCGVLQLREAEIEKTEPGEFTFPTAMSQLPVAIRIGDRHGVRNSLFTGPDPAGVQRKGSRDVEHESARQRDRTNPSTRSCSGCSACHRAAFDHSGNKMFARA